jgi:hypothetical protein
MLLTKDQIDVFKRDGVLTLRGVFSPDEIDSWRREVLTFFENPKKGDQWCDAQRTRKSHDFRFDPGPTPLATLHFRLFTAVCTAPYYGPVKTNSSSEQATSLRHGSARVRRTGIFRFTRRYRRSPTARSVCRT